MEFEQRVGAQLHCPDQDSSAVGRTEGFEPWGTSVLKIDMPKYLSFSGPKCHLSAGFRIPVSD